MAQPYEIELSDPTSAKVVQIPYYRHGERQIIRVTNAEKPLVIGLAGSEGGTGEEADAVYTQPGVAVPGVENAYDFVLTHSSINSVVGEGRTFYFNIWEYDPEDEALEGEVRAIGSVPVGLSIYVPRTVMFPPSVITAIAAGTIISASTLIGA